MKYKKDKLKNKGSFGQNKEQKRYNLKIRNMLESIGFVFKKKNRAQYGLLMRKYSDLLFPKTRTTK